MELTIKQIDYIEDVKDWLPYYVFDILLDKSIIGRLIFRTGTNEQHLYDGHIGYTIEPEYQGHCFAYQACLKLKPFMMNLGYKEVIITCSPENIASSKTIEKLGANYIQTSKIPSILRKDFEYHETMKDIYKWQLKNDEKQFIIA